MKSALVLLSLVALNSHFLHARTVSNTECDAAISKASHSSTPQLWHGLAKSSQDLYAVTTTLHENRRIMEESAEAGKSFDLVRKEAAKAGFPFGVQNLPYYERIYWKMYVTKNCDDSNLAAGLSGPRNAFAHQGQVSIPNDDFFEHQVGDVTRDLAPAPNPSTPAESAH